MASEIFPVIASDQYAERKNSSLNAVHLSPSPSMISKQQLASSTIVRYTVHDWEIYSKKDIKLFTQPSVKSSDELLVLSRLGAWDEVTVNRRFPEIRGEIIRKNEAPAVGHHFRHGLLAYIGPWFQNGGGSRKALVCDSTRPSGMDLYYTGLPDARYALETLPPTPTSSPRTTVFLAGPQAVRLEWRTDWIDCERSLFTPCSWLRRFFFFLIIGTSAASSVAVHGLPEADHCEQRIEYRTRNSEASCSIPSLASDCG